MTDDHEQPQWFNDVVDAIRKQGPANLRAALDRPQRTGSDDMNEQERRADYEALFARLTARQCQLEADMDQMRAQLRDQMDALWRDIVAGLEPHRSQPWWRKALGMRP